jgi:hypothetical protein
VEVADPPEGGKEEDYVLVVRRGEEEVARYASGDLKRGGRGPLGLPGDGPAPVAVAEVTRSRRPASGRYPLAIPPAERPDAAAFVGDVEARTGLGGLAAIDEITMLVAPDLMAPGAGGDVDLDRARAVQAEMVDQCTTLHDRMAILDPPSGSTVQEILARRTEAMPDSGFAVLYYPWLGVYDPCGSQPLFVPPSGHMAGVWSRTDAQRGVHKAPANETLTGVLELQTQVTRAEQALLNPLGINVIRSFPGRGIRVWGARTLATSKQEWRYVNVRRLFNYLEESIAEGTHWVVFEPNDQDLWQRIKRTVGAFLLTTWRDGALFGRKPEEAFYVKCDEETNPPDVIEQGRVVIEVGVAPVKPAEFVVFQIAQLTSGAMVGE